MPREWEIGCVNAGGGNIESSVQEKETAFIDLLNLIESALYNFSMIVHQATKQRIDSGMYIKLIRERPNVLLCFRTPG